MVVRARLKAKQRGAQDNRVPSHSGKGPVQVTPGWSCVTEAEQQHKGSEAHIQTPSVKNACVGLPWWSSG